MKEPYVFTTYASNKKFTQLKTGEVLKFMITGKCCINRNKFCFDTESSKSIEKSTIFCPWDKASGAMSHIKGA